MTTTAPDQWQLQEAKQRFSELIRAVHTNGPQFVTKHGQQVAVVLDIVDYRRMVGVERVEDFKSFLMSAPDMSDLEIERPIDPERPVDFE
ncbi:type II toxin-antitoxin system Phd/YefM family antitoxin [Kribbella jejuensis]|uniref:Antitoxin n=1 Tax=Kribbella jejuensis TaxID=236068 RepID=A0A542EKW1_9ACTN|nr:type II toxin-antitoxin system Phd/YefM family antitoxin [Kribbella jejuensis]TQJ15980.1 prevent-host-death family protein [Kribbella jejuensis]